MLTYLARRLLLMIPTLLVISLLIFIIIKLPPGDYLTNQIAELRAQEKPPPWNAPSCCANSMRSIARGLSNMRSGWASGRGQTVSRV